jgi:hypothetical protein
LHWRVQARRRASWVQGMRDASRDQRFHDSERGFRQSELSLLRGLDFVRN